MLNLAIWGTMGHADWGTMGHLIIVPWSLLLVCLPKKFVEMLLKSIDIAIIDLFVKYQRHHGKTTKLQGEVPLIYTSGEVKALLFYT